GQCTESEICSSRRIVDVKNIISETEVIRAGLYHCLTNNHILVVLGRESGIMKKELDGIKK
ncbi:hypothetical protein HAX54_046558, partial [Datura stramonium]|nr:hypothetical protein [Datura stramonium]